MWLLDLVTLEWPRIEIVHYLSVIGRYRETRMPSINDNLIKIATRFFPLQEKEKNQGKVIAVDSLFL